MIATGTDPFMPPIPGLADVPFWTNREATLPVALPESLVILGGGAIGVELGQAYARIGSKVHIVEGGPRLVPAEEPEAGELLGKHLAGEGISVHVAHKVVGVEKTATGIRVLVDGAPGIEGEVLLVATGRRPRLGTIDLSAARLTTNERGWLKVDQHTLLAEGRHLRRRRRHRPGRLHPPVLLPRPADRPGAGWKARARRPLGDSACHLHRPRGRLSWPERSGRAPQAWT